MLWRHLCLARAWSAAGLLTCSMLAAPALVRAEPQEPAPTAAPATETVRVLDARHAGDVALEVRGQGQDKVRIAIRNTSTKRLNVVLPPGLVASSATGQRAGGGFQSMGLGTPNNRPGSFGQFRGLNGGESGFQSIPVRPEDQPGTTVTVPVGQSVDLTIPAVCLNFGLPTPTARDRFELMDVDDYTPDPRARKALRTLATLGTSQGVAQATMWRICNGVPFEAMIAQAGKVINVAEVGLAARFVEALDAAGESELIDPAYLTESRLLVRVSGEGALASEATRLASSLDGLHILGLPARVVDGGDLPEPSAPALLLNVTLSGSRPGETRGHLAVSHARRGEGWVPLGKTTFTEGSTVSVLDGPGLARALDHAVAAAFVSVKIARRGTGSTTLRVENRLPFTLARVSLKAGASSGNAPVAFTGLGVGPGRAALVPIQAATGTVDRVELNGL